MYHGSSPRMRGTPRDHKPMPDWARFIPAHAGNTSGTRRCLSSVPVHPRACGEHPLWIEFILVIVGSSPRMRGTRNAMRHGTLDRRFIPAHAGNTSNYLELPGDMTVHPRACGEHSDIAQNAINVDGSSPRMRGTHLPQQRRNRDDRFIPAHAGNTPTSNLRHCGISVHPRACGEHISDQPQMRYSSGSSPRMRGTRRTNRRLPRMPRFIPAHAGNTQTNVPSGTTLAGSSPRMRGTLNPLLAVEGNIRFIPAHAGNTVSSLRIRML